MTVLVICWYSMFGLCLDGYQHKFPTHFSCVIAKRLWIDRWIEDGVKEPVFIKCKRQVKNELIM